MRETAAVVLRTPKDAMDLVALYWRDGKRPMPHAFKAAIRDGFARWTPYQVAKYATMRNVTVRLRDLLFLTHPTPAADRTELLRKLANDELKAPDTWEAALSRPGADKRAEWERLLSGRQLGALAVIRNLRNMEAVGVDHELVCTALETVRAADVWPWQALAAAREAPSYAHDLNALMVRSAGELPRLPGHTGVLVDVSGSMDAAMSERGTMTRIDAGAGLAVVLREVCERSTVAAFSDQVGILKQPMPRGAGLARIIVECMPHGGTRLAHAVAAFRDAVPGLDRLVILTDEQGQDGPGGAGGLETFVVNVASTQRGLAWEGRVTRIDGWSGAIVRFLAQEIAGATIAVGDQDAEEEAAAS